MLGLFWVLTHTQIALNYKYNCEEQPDLYQHQLHLYDLQTLNTVPPVVLLLQLGPKTNKNQLL